MIKIEYHFIEKMLKGISSEHLTAQESWRLLRANA
jgi:hypothetical protein